MPKLNIKLLNRIKRHLLAEPQRYNQSGWAEVYTKESYNDAPSCGTRACIGGWAVFLSVPPKRWKWWMEADDWGRVNIQNRARKLLGLTELEAGDLFSPTNQRYQIGSKGVKEACKKIDALIESRR